MFSTAITAPPLSYSKVCDTFRIKNRLLLKGEVYRSKIR